MCGRPYRFWDTELMEQDFPIISPCVGVCQINAQTGYCLGCWRTLKEVARWSRFSDQEKRDVLDELHRRRGDAAPRARRVTRRRARRTVSAK